MSYLESPEEHKARIEVNRLQRRLSWLRLAKPARWQSLRTADNMVRLGYGWEDIQITTRLPAGECRRLVFRGHA